MMCEKDHPKHASSGAKRRLKLAICGAVIILASLYLVYSAARGSAAYYMTVGELLREGTTARNVRVAGTIVEGSILWDERELTLRFEIADESGKLPVVYRGLRPDMFREGAEVVVEGRYFADGGFQAKKLILKCPSKYQEAASG